MSGSFRIARIADIDIKIHITFFLILILAAFQWSGITGSPAGALFGVVLMLLLAASVRGQDERGDDETTEKGIHNMSRCNGKLGTAAVLPLPTIPCSRTDLSRSDICSLLAMPPPRVPLGSVPAHSRVFADRNHALDILVPRNGSLVEVGTLTGAFTRWMLRQLRPISVVAMDVSGYAIRECASKTQRYKGVCGDLEAARPKVKIGGLMALNDYYLFETVFLAQRGRWGVYGIIHATHEFLARYASGWEVAYITMSPLAGGNQADIGLRRVR